MKEKQKFTREYRMSIQKMTNIILKEYLSITALKVDNKKLWPSSRCGNGGEKKGVKCQGYKNKTETTRHRR